MNETVASSRLAERAAWSMPRERGAAAEPPGRGVVVLGFDPCSRTWITEPRAARSAQRGLHLPRLDGTLTAEASAVRAGAPSEPIVVLSPGSVEDVARMARYAQRHGLRIMMYGQAHGAHWRAQTGGAIVVDSTKLSRVHFLTGDRLRAGAGARWSDLARAARERGARVSIHDVDLDQRVGETLAGGAVGRRSDEAPRKSEILDLEVVTPGGDVVLCSRARDAVLFDAVLSGLRQRTFIVGATFRLLWTPPARPAT